MHSGWDMVENVYFYKTKKLKGEEDEEKKTFYGMFTQRTLYRGKYFNVFNIPVQKLGNLWLH